jgi:probable rRNA maturation factor
MSPGPKRPRLRVTVTDERGRSLMPGLARWLAAIAPATARGDVSVAVVPDRVVRRLNRLYRDKDSATDVLSFPATDSAPRTKDQGRTKSQGRTKHQGPRPTDQLGDIIISRGVAERQAREAGHGVRIEFRVLALHGLLHLLGYDHEVDAGTMARVERRLRRKGGLREGLIERQ